LSIKEGIFHSDRGIFCADPRAQMKTDKDVYGDGNRIVCKVAYRPFGIRFVLASTVNYRNNWFPLRGNLLMAFQYKYEVRCNKDKNGGEVFGNSYYICANPDYNNFCIKKMQHILKLSITKIGLPSKCVQYLEC
jgi:predicted porin